MSEALILLIGNMAMRLGPWAAQEFALAAHKADPTPADFQKFFDLAKEDWIDAKPGEIIPAQPGASTP